MVRMASNSNAVNLHYLISFIVYEILLAFSTNGGDWKKAFHHVIPPRKLQPTTTGSTSSSQQEAEDQLSPLASPSQAFPDQTSSQNSNSDRKSIEDQTTVSQPSTSHTLSENVPVESEGTSDDPSISDESREGWDNLDEPLEDDIHSQLEPSFPDFD